MGDIFDLDEERELEQKTADEKNAISTTTPSSSSSLQPPQPVPPTSLLRPPSTTPLLSPLPQPFTQALPQHRKHASSFAATPSFPSPLAQAITVPAHSDTSSSSSNSNASDDEEGGRQSKRSVASKDSGTPRIGQDGTECRARTASPKMKEASASPTSTERSMSRSTSPALQRALSVSPGALLSKGRRSDASRDLAPIATGTAGSTPRTSPTSRKSSPIQSRRLTDASREYPPAIPNHVRRRSGSYSSALDTPLSTSSQAGSSPLAFGSPELDPIDDDHPRRTSGGSTSSPQESSRDSPNILGLGLGGNWDTTSTASSSSRSGSMKGKSKEGPPPSPRRERDRMSTSGMPIASPPRQQRRPSEFLNPTSLDMRKMPLAGGRNTSAMPNLSSSASMISPLNPLPSPWTTSSDSSSAFSPAASETSATTPSSGSGAIRLNRVPTSVRLAAELIKNPSSVAMSPPQHNLSLQQSGPTDSSNLKGSFPVAPVPTNQDTTPKQQVSSGITATRELAAFSSMPPPSLPHSKPPFNIGKGRPTLSVPATPSSTRNSSYIDKSPTSAIEPVPLGRVTSTGSIAPPTSYKAPAALIQSSKTRPSAPPESNSQPSGPFNTQSKTHRYRTSMHEATFKSGFAGKADSSSWTTGLSGAGSTSGGAKSAGLGLGFNVPQTAVRLDGKEGSGSAPKPNPQDLPRLRSVTGQGLAMDLAGFSSVGDAASHASMIMQSRQAKLQRWRPTSSGSAGPSATSERPLPPAFNRSTTTGSPAMLAGPRADRQAQWGLARRTDEMSVASSPGEDLPPVPVTMPGLTDPNDSGMVERATMRSDFMTGASGSMAHSNIGPDRLLPTGGGQAMTRTGSATAQIGGVEWIDWMDEYKRYKEVKIRADAEAAKLKAQAEMPPPPLPASVSTTASPSEEPSAKASPVATEYEAREELREIDLTSSVADISSAVDLTRSSSRDDFGPSGSLRKRSMSIRSQLSSLDPTRSPGQRRLSIFERPRHSSNGSAKSDVPSIVQAGKKKKNLVNKMEGWWNAVKSNFVPETNLPHQPHRPSNLGVYAERRVPSAPASRRSSGKSPMLSADPDLMSIGMSRRDTSQSLRQATSHAELRSPTLAAQSSTLEPAASISASNAARLAQIARSSSTLDVPTRYAATGDHQLASDYLLAAPRTSLENRRRQPNLRLELEPHVLTQVPLPSRGQSSNGSISALPARLSTVNSSQSDSHRPSEHTSRSSSYGHGSMGPGLTPGVPRWDQSPSPIFALTTSTAGDQKDGNTPAPGADISIASVRRHVKHRLNGAKETCDKTLLKVIELITRFADETKARDEMAMEDRRRQEEQKDYFENISDSPIFDGEESDFEGGPAYDGSRSRNVSGSRGPSRRPSISKPSLASSPSRRTSIAPSSPNRTTRRRPSAVPRSYVGRDRLNRSVGGLGLDKSQSATSSRSTSRSRSPMPMFAQLLPSVAATEEDAEADRQFLASLQELIVIATDVLESSVNSLISKPAACTEIIQKLQRVGQNWDEHDNWPGRDWYVEILMAIAGLRRVLDWWEAEKGFWAFDYEDENEPLLFVLKPREESRFEQEFRAHNDRSISPMRPLSDLPTSTSTPDVSTAAISPGISTAKNSQNESAPDNAKAKGAEDLKYMAEQAKMVNIVMELGLEGEEIEYVNDAILEVTGQDPDEIMGKPINDLLAPADANSFAEATQKLLEDDNNTVQMRVRIEVRDLDNDRDEHQPGPVYVEVEGVGMLMREHNEPSHTMWVFKPVNATQRDSEIPADASFPVERILSNEGILCRICEREIVSWFFEKHNETCDAVHRLEAEISDCNECLKELCHTIAKLKKEIENVNTTASPTHQGVLFYNIPDSLADTAEAPVGPQGIEIRKVAPHLLDEAIDVLKTAELIETPSVREDEADLEFNVQRYLPRESEDRLAAITRWHRPHDVDRALTVLITHVETQLRRKHKAIARMQSTIRYSEKTRHEWEDKVNRLLEELSDTSGSESGSDPVEGDSIVVDEPAAGPDVSPPNTRKIAPQARIPITVGHPQRPATAHVGSTFDRSIPPPPPATADTARPNLGSAPPTAALLAPNRPEPVRRSQSTHGKRQSPLQIPADRMSHARRVSTSRAFMTAPLSPRIPSAASQPRAAPPSIKDFEIIKPISRGAFGSVYLAKKVATGDYYAIKALKKSDMIAKNQITNVKAERTILMNQSSSPYVAKLFFSFQSKEYLYLVMEYLNGGDCATLVKTLGGLPEEWTRNYIAEVVLGLEYLHVRNIVHRDIKPDNLLIDSRGHLKLTDFGLSKIGLLNRQVGGPRPAYLRGTSLGSSRRPLPTSRSTGARVSSTSSGDSPMLSPELQPPPIPSNLGLSYLSKNDIGSADESSGTESVSGVVDLMRQISIVNKTSSGAPTPSVTGDGVSNVPRFVGTPDYLAPESILGIGTDDRMVDWWALGVVLYEFLYGFPPFHDDSPEKVFDNVVSRRINWFEDEIEISAEARDLMDRLMSYDPMQRLGARGADEVKQHAFFAGLDWSTVTTNEASFVPEVTDPESTDYFDARGANNAFHDDEAVPQVLKQKRAAADGINAVVDDISGQDDFGAFEFRNLPVLKQANDDVIKKLRRDSLAPGATGLDTGAGALRDRGRSASASANSRKVSKRHPSDLIRAPSPTTSTSSAASTPSRPLTPLGSTPGSGAATAAHSRKQSEMNALDRVKSSEDPDLARRNSAPSRVRAGSDSKNIPIDSTSQEMWRQRRQASLNTETMSAPAREDEGRDSDHLLSGSALESGPPSRRGSDRALDVLIAEDNPISQKILETLLTRMGCRCVCVEDGSQALASTMGSIRFDVIICDIRMPVVSGEQVARMIRSTNNHNQNTPIIAATSYEQSDIVTEEGTLFSAVLNKPVTKAALVSALAKLGFELASAGIDDSPAQASHTLSLPVVTPGV